MEEKKIYEFSFTEEDVEALKQACRNMSLSFTRFRHLYKMLCEAVCDEYDRALIKKFEN